MECKKMAHAIGLIAWGYLFLYFNLNLGSLNLIPSWVGYLLMGKAIKELKGVSPAMGLLGPLCILLAALELWFWALTLIGINSQHYLLQLLSLLLAVAALYFHFQLLTNSGSSGGNVAKRTAEPADGANRPGGGHGSAGAMERAFCGDCDPGDCRGTGWYFDQRGAVLDTECPFQVAVSSGRKRIEKQDARRVMVHSSRPVFLC